MLDIQVHNTCNHLGKNVFSNIEYMCFIGIKSLQDITQCHGSEINKENNSTKEDIFKFKISEVVGAVVVMIVR